jgi:fatty acid desaturase
MAWHHSLQHELIHHHPSRRLWINTALGFPPLSLWLPYIRYRALHLSHHRDDLLTDPIEDPESYYMMDAAWQRRGPIGRAATRLLNTVVGGILFRPLVATARFLFNEATALAAGSGERWRVWGLHLLGVIAVIVWVEAVCGISFWRYLGFFVYPGLALTAVRSFAEHRAAHDPAHRTAIVEHAPILGLLFLYNNLHVVHHRHPGMPWYAIPRYYRLNREGLLRLNDGLVYRGYRDVIGRYLVREHHSPAIPQSCLPGRTQTVAGEVRPSQALQVELDGFA